MVKIDPAAVLDIPASERISRHNPRTYRDNKDGFDDVVKISDEGKKKHILGALMARISEGGKG